MYKSKGFSLTGEHNHICVTHDIEPGMFNINVVDRVSDKATKIELSEEDLEKLLNGIKEIQSY